MRYVADRFVVILDANVLFPFRKRDVLLRFSHAGLFRARWSSEILDERTRNQLDRKPHLEDSIRAQQRAMQDHFPKPSSPATSRSSQHSIFSTRTIGMCWLPPFNAAPSIS